MFYLLSPPPPHYAVSDVYIAKCMGYVCLTHLHLILLFIICALLCAVYHYIKSYHHTAFAAGLIIMHQHHLYICSSPFQNHRSHTKQLIY